MTAGNLLYLRRGNAVKGPFAAGAVREFLAAKQIRPSDEVSVDQSYWVPASQMDKVLHQEEARVATSLVEQRRRAARRAAEAGPLGEEEMPSRVRLPLAPLGVVTALFLLIVVFGIWYGKPGALLPPQCQAPAAPGVVWRNCALDGIDARDSHLQHADLRAVHMRGADLSRADLSGADASYALLRGANLNHANLSSVNLKGADLRDADLAGANLTGVDLSHADLRGARLSGAVLKAVRLRNTIWIDGRTCKGVGPERCLSSVQEKDSVSYR